MKPDWIGKDGMLIHFTYKEYAKLKKILEEKNESM